MRKFKWGILALCFLALTACAKEEVWLSSKDRPMPAQEERVPAAEPEEKAVPKELTIWLDGQELDCGSVWFGGSPFVHKEQIETTLQHQVQEEQSVQVDGESYVSLEALCEELGYECCQDLPRNAVYLAHAQPWQIPEGYSVPTLMYHGVSDQMWGMTELFVRPSNMEAQIRYLVENGYTPIWFEDLVHVDQIEKPVLLTFDDGYVDNYTDLFPILQKYNVKATIFVVTGTIDYNPNSLTTAQIREMAQSGLVSFQSHTVTHPYLRGQSREMQEYELAQSRMDIAAITGKLPTVICYPSGSFDETTLELARQYYQMGINMNGNEYITGEDPYRVDRYYIRRQDGLGTFIQYIQ